ncbi:MAG: methylated-DNA--[protein]-cysteine S-methyltransferase [Caulobacter sp.]|nr:methylated-DNA--[protein]-cysteine S-methyltransferase [Caulobacter sp.]
MSLAFTVFDTAIGACALVWADSGIVGAFLPERDAATTRARVIRRHPEAVETEPPPAVAETVAGVVALMAGERRDLADAPLDLSACPPFHRKVYEVVRGVPPGRTMTYGEVALALGQPREAARAVGEAMGRNPIPILMPCHRVLGANGKPGGFSAPGGVETKLKMLEIEGARVGETPTLFDALPLAVKPGRQSSTGPSRQ